MTDGILSVGIDIGTTTTHMVVSKLLIDKAKIIDRKIIFTSPIEFTPLTKEGEIDAASVADLIDRTYKDAGLKASDIATGAVIITGESARKRNAQSVTREISGVAGDFVVESAGPALESLLAARGSGAIAYSKSSGKLILNIDIGGGTSNYALIKAGEVVGLSCIDIGGRALTFTRTGKVKTVSSCGEILLAHLKSSRPTSEKEISEFALYLTELLMVATGKPGVKNIAINEIELTKALTQAEALTLTEDPDEIWFSGGVAALMRLYIDSPGQFKKLKEENPYGDLGFYLAQELVDRHKQFRVPFKIAAQDIRATVIGASSESLQISGITINIDSDELPLKNLPLLKIKVPETTFDLSKAIGEAIKFRGGAPWSERMLALYLDLTDQLNFQQLKNLACALASAACEHQAIEPFIFVLSQDLAMALSQLLVGEMGNKRIITVDGVDAQEGDYLDIGLPIGKSSDRKAPCVTLVVKTLLFYK